MLTFQEYISEESLGINLWDVKVTNKAAAAAKRIAGTGKEGVAEKIQKELEKMARGKRVTGRDRNMIMAALVQHQGWDPTDAGYEPQPKS